MCNNNSFCSSEDTGDDIIQSAREAIDDNTILTYKHVLSLSLGKYIQTAIEGWNTCIISIRNDIMTSIVVHRNSLNHQALPPKMS